MSFILLHSPDEFTYNRVYAWRILEDMDAPATQSYSWQILNSVTAALAYSWVIWEYITKTLEYSWMILQNASRFLGYSWRIFQYTLASLPRFITTPVGRTKIFGGSDKEVHGDVKRHRFWGTK
jgi:hypothetical protein